MIKYFLVATALKAFSLTPRTRQMYRHLGNTVGASRRSRAGLPGHYEERARWILNTFETYGIAREGGEFLELGTGWLHWESTVLRLFYDARFTLFDVWDNRQFEAFQVYFGEFRERLDSQNWIPASEREHARQMLDAVLAANSFDEVYDLLGFTYVVEPTGTLTTLRPESFDACFSYNVFEHIDSAILSDYLKELYGRLKPGGYSFIHVDMSDHLANYDRRVGRKHYVRYSDAAWGRYFENGVQYFNRVQRAEWLGLFRDAGFELVNAESLYAPAPDRIDQKYESLGREEIECTALEIVHRRPV